MKSTDKKVAAVIVAFNRDTLLKRSLEAVSAQERSVDKIIVVDNACLESTHEIVSSYGAVYLEGHVDNGSGGGFAIGIEYAVKNKFDFVWTLDDDGYAEPKCLDVLLNSIINNKFDVVSPLNISIENNLETANPYIFGIRKEVSVSKIQRKDFWMNKAQFYNGMLINKHLVERIGFPKKELFLRGDEMDYYYRAKRSGARIGLVPNAIFFHPSGKSEFPNNRTSFLGVVIPKTEQKKYYQFRNRGYLIQEYRLFFNALYDWIRYPFYFLLFPGKNLPGFLEWKEFWLQGFRQDLKPFDSKNK
jgi:rhamnopyranosyl-N-acetylglucosaminyl-diphospho-decaprenol beta-1,3/1,4-galactofuranosyltransferase